MATTKRGWRNVDAPTQFIPYKPHVRCTACGVPAMDGAWCSRAECLAIRDAYRLELAAFAQKYPEIQDRLAAIARGEAPALQRMKAVA